MRCLIGLRNGQHERGKEDIRVAQIERARYVVNADQNGFSGLSGHHNSCPIILVETCNLQIDFASKHIFQSSRT